MATKRKPSKTPPNSKGKTSAKSGGRRGAASRRAGRRSPWHKVARVVAWVLILAGGIYVVYLSGRGLQHLFFTGNPHFTLEHLEVHVTGRLTPEEVSELLDEQWDIQKGETNLFEIDPGELRDNLMNHKSGLVNYLTIRRVLPDTLELCIYERQPVARLGRKPNSMLIDGEGWILPPRDMRRKKNQYLLDLPVITGIRNREDLGSFSKTGDDLLLATLDFLRVCNANAYSNWLEVRLVRLDYAGEALHVYPADRGTFTKGAQVVVPLENMEQALRRVERIVRHRARAQQTTSHINATYKNNVPVRP
ncbi:MAG: cell division protein FtsQ/DivIB [Verrucomicrobiota bacterium]